MALCIRLRCLSQSVVRLVLLTGVISLRKKQTEYELDEKCWKGYEKKGMKTMFGKRYPNCVKKDQERRSRVLLMKRKVVMHNHKGEECPIMVRKNAQQNLKRQKSKSSNPPSKDWTDCKVLLRFQRQNVHLSEDVLPTNLFLIEQTFKIRLKKFTQVQVTSS